MPSQDDFPDSWDQDCEGKQTIVEVAVPALSGNIAEGLDASVLEAGFNWVEIPVSSVETWSSKDNNVSIKRTAKIQFPTEWDGGNVRNVVSGYGISGLTFGRIKLKNDDGTEVLKHCGYIAGVGGGSNPLESKAWFYDMSELMKAIPINQTFNDPTIQDVARQVSTTIIEKTPIPLTGTVLIPPKTEEEFAVLFNEDPDINASDTYISFDESNPVDAALIQNADGFELSEVDTGIDLDTIQAFGGIVGRFLAKQFGIGTRDFRANRDTLFDVLNWLRDRTDVQWHFEPTENGVALLLDVLPSRRTFAQDDVISELNAEDLAPSQVGDEDETYPIHDTITVEDNNALYEINPPNTVLALGDTSRSNVGTPSGTPLQINGVKIYETLTGGPDGSSFPVVKVRADPLYEAANEVELALETVESDAQSIDQLKVDAVTALRKAITGSSEGKITCLGNPYIKPYDVLDAFETCGEYVAEQQVPVRYEVQSVKHEETIDSLYRTTLNVTVFVGDEQFSFPLETTRTT